MQHAGIIGEQRQKRLAAADVYQRVGRGEPAAPCHEPPYGAHEPVCVGGSLALAAQGLPCEGETVHDIREEREQLHEQGVHGEHPCALTRAGRHEEQVDGHEEKRAQEYVAVDGEEPPHGSATERAAQPYPRPEPAVAYREQRDGYDKPCILRYERARGHAVDAHARAVDEQQARRYVHHVLRHRHHHRGLSVLHAYEPPRQSVQAQHGGCAPHAYIIIGVDERKQVAVCADDPHRHR